MLDSLKKMRMFEVLQRSFSYAEKDQTYYIKNTGGIPVQVRHVYLLLCNEGCSSDLPFISFDQMLQPKDNRNQGKISTEVANPPQANVNLPLFQKIAKELPFRETVGLKMFLNVFAYGYDVQKAVNIHGHETVYLATSSILSLAATLNDPYRDLLDEFALSIIDQLIEMEECHG